MDDLKYVKELIKECQKTRGFRNYGGKVKIEVFAIAVDLKEGRTPNGVRVKSWEGLCSTERCTPNGVQKA
jgi:hypothetical protein